MRAFKEKLDKLLAGFLSLLMAVLVFDVLWQVFTRFILRDPSSYTEELARFLLIWVGVLGGAYAAGLQMHLAVDLITPLLKGRWKRLSDLFIQAVVFLFALLVMLIGGMRLVFITLSLDQTSAALQWKLGYVYLVIPLSGLLIMFYSGFMFAGALRRKMWKPARS